jgi:hypothetical protein
MIHEELLGVNLGLIRSELANADRPIGGAIAAWVSYNRPRPQNIFANEQEFIDSAVAPNPPPPIDSCTFLVLVSDYAGSTWFRLPEPDTWGEVVSDSDGSSWFRLRDPDMWEGGATV